MPRKTKRTQDLSARDTYHVVGPTGDLAVKGPAGPQDPAAIALVTAQGQATHAKVPVTYHVERRSLFGPSVRLYRVERTEDGRVLTWKIEAVD